jgi:hypothetical protein
MRTRQGRQVIEQLNRVHRADLLVQLSGRVEGGSQTFVRLLDHAPPLSRRTAMLAHAADRARRQLLDGSGDVTLRGQHLPGPAADVRLGRRGCNAVRHGRTPNDDGEDTQE